MRAREKRLGYSRAAIFTSSSCFRTKRVANGQIDRLFARRFSKAMYKTRADNLFN